MGRKGKLIGMRNYLVTYKCVIPYMKKCSDSCFGTEHGGGYEVIFLSRVYVEWERRYVLIRLTKGIML